MYLRSQVLWGSTKGLGSGTISDFFLAQPKVCELDVAIAIQQQVLKL
jgi:hypothetical protein